jgi:broad specificity phosphatase PhoE
MTTKKTIYLTRHGETEFNRLGIVQGSGVDSPLNDTGNQQAEMFFQHYKSTAFDKVYTSALQRTYQSVRKFIEELGVPHEKLAGLNEISWGEYEGVSGKTAWREDYYKMIAEWEKGNLHHRVPNGENPIELQQRQKPALNHILQNTHEQTVLVCMHGRAMKSFLCLMLDLPLQNMDTFSHRNLGLYILEYENGRFEIIKNNNAEHLQNAAI